MLEQRRVLSVADATAQHTGDYSKGCELSHQIFKRPTSSVAHHEILKLGRDRFCERSPHNDWHDFDISVRFGRLLQDGAQLECSVRGFLGNPLRIKRSASDDDCG